MSINLRASVKYKMILGTSALRRRIATISSHGPLKTWKSCCTGLIGANASCGCAR